MATQVFTVRDTPVPSKGSAIYEFTFASGEAFSFNHGFAGVPYISQMYLRCVAIDQGYAVGDEVDLTDSAHVSCAVNALTLKCTLAALPSVVNPSNSTAGAITAVKWVLGFYLEQ